MTDAEHHSPRSLSDSPLSESLSIDPLLRTKANRRLTEGDISLPLTFTPDKCPIELSLSTYDKKIIFLPFNPQSLPPIPEAGRAGMVMPYHSEKQIQLAHQITNAIKDLWDEAREKKSHLADRLSRQITPLEREIRTRENQYYLEKNPFYSVNTESLQVRLDVLRQGYQVCVNRLLQTNPELSLQCNAAMTEPLALFLCLQSQNNPEGFLAKVPRGFLSHESYSFALEVQAVAQYILPRFGYKEPREFLSAKEVEDLSNWSGLFASCGLRSLSRILPASEFIKLAFPGFCHSERPIIREWKIPGLKWKGSSTEEKAQIRQLVARATRCALLESGVANSERKISLERLCHTKWNEFFHMGEWGLSGALQHVPQVRSAIDLLELAIPQIFSLVPRHRFEYPGKWQGEQALITLDEVTRHLVEKRLKLFGPNGDVSPEQLKWISNWYARYEEECSGALKHTGHTAAQALERVYPRLFGWSKGQIYPGMIRYENMWEGEKGERLFCLRFAKLIFDLFPQPTNPATKVDKQVPPVFDPEAERPLQISRKDILRVREILQRNGLGWGQLISRFDLEGGYAAVAKNSPERAFEILFGKCHDQSFEFGNSGIYRNDLLSLSSAQQIALQGLLKEFDLVLSHEAVVLTGIAEGHFGNFELGIERACFSRLIDSSDREIFLAKLSALYSAFISATISGEGDRNTAFEALVAGSRRNKLGRKVDVLSNQQLCLLLKTVAEDFLPRIQLPEPIRHSFREALNCLLELPPWILRDTLIAAIEVDRSQLTGNDSLSLLNSICSHVFSLLTIHEIRENRIFGSYSALYNKLYASA